MPESPPPLRQSPTGSKVWIIIGSLVAVVVLFGVFIVTAANMAVSKGGFTVENSLAEQHLKTVVALVELHKLRYNSYPQSLTDLKFVSEWDQLALKRVKYSLRNDGANYHLESKPGFKGQPKLDIPAEFWEGTGHVP